MTGLQEFARAEHVSAGHFTAIGAFARATVAYFDWDSRRYERIPVAEQVEVLSLAGTIAIKDESPAVHAHVVLGKRDGAACGGHLMEGHVRPTLEVTLVESPAHLERIVDPESGLPLIRRLRPEGARRR